MAQAGISLRPSLLPFSPWETLESYLELLTFFESQHLVEHVDPVHLSIRLLIPPGSSLLETPEEKPWLDELDAAAYTYRWHNPDPRMDTLHQDVAQLVAQAQVTRQDPVATFFQVKSLALQACGQTADAATSFEQYGTGKMLPHLSESWFC
ncbi:MAG: CUAEP/CCAEP-tail radical SAM (seleno)protein, partial [Ktedonobacteraceae bacterium]